MRLRAPWSLDLTTPGRCGLVAVRSGRAVLQLEAGAIPLEAGDLCILLEPGAARLVDAVGSTASPVRCPEGACTSLHEADDDGTRAIVGSFELVDRLAHPFLSSLPPLLHLTTADTRGRIEASLSLLAAEAADVGMGSALSIARLFELVFLQTLRAYLEHRCTVCEVSGASWLRAVTDPELRSAVAAVHEQPLEDWSVERLARRVGMSRTSFATRFSASMGMSPMRYLTRWRLHLAATRLAEHGTLAEAAEAAGYGSEAAFAKAFKRELGVSPGRFRATASMR